MCVCATGAAAETLGYEEGPMSRGVSSPASRAVRDYLAHGNPHCLHYIAEDCRPHSDRCVWAFLCLTAILGATYLMTLVGQRYITSPTVTAIESTHYAIADIPFPSVTLCNNNRVQWGKAMLFQQQFLSGASDITVASFHGLLQALAQARFSEFNLIGTALKRHLQGAAELAHLNITHLMLQVMPSCEEMFPELCWWRNGLFNCCSLFEVQRTEYGFCYSFNSEISENRTRSRTWKVTGDAYLRRPRRTNRPGPWGGLRLAVDMSQNEAPPGVNATSTVIMIGNPHGYPTTGYAINAGHFAQMSVAAHVTYTTPRVRSLKISDRKCLYSDESDALRLGGYLHQNCVVQCHQEYTARYCNCTSYLHPPTGNVEDCNVSGLLCLSKYNDVFRRYQPLVDSPYFSDLGRAMRCPCLPDCEQLEYQPRLLLTRNKDGAGGEQTVRLDVHFESSAVILYRTDLLFGVLDLLGSFGNIAALFLGCSVLSVAELLYFCTVRLYWHWRESRHHPRHPARNAIHVLK